MMCVAREMVMMDGACLLATQGSLHTVSPCTTNSEWSRRSGIMMDRVDSFPWIGRQGL